MRPSRSHWHTWPKNLLLATLTACGSMESPVEPARDVGTLVPPLPALIGPSPVEREMGAVGCFEVVGGSGKSKVGDILFHVEGGRLAQYRCPGSSRSAVREAIRKYKQGSGNASGMSSSMAGYWVLTITSTRYCTQVVEYAIINGVKTWSRTYWDEGSCQWIDEIMVEWVGVDEPDPWTDCCPGGGSTPPPAPPDTTPTTTPTPDSLSTRFDNFTASLPPRLLKPKVA